MKICSSAPTLFALEPMRYSCRGCGSSFGQTAFGRERFLGTGQELFLCSACGLAYLAPDFTDAALDLFYREHYRKVALIEASDRYDARYFQHHLSREFAQKRAALLAPDLPHGARVLEIGSGSGAFLGQLHQLRPDIALYATETDAAHRELLLDGAHVTFIDHHALPQQLPFDAIVALHVVEHLKHTLTDLRDYGAALAPSGRLYVEVPDVEAAWGNWLYVHPAHLSYFSAASLARTLTRAGLNVERNGPHPCGPAFAGTIWAVATHRTTQALPIASAPAQEIVALSQHIARYQWSLKQSLRMVARRALIGLIGVYKAGTLVRWRCYRRYRHFFAV